MLEGPAAAKRTSCGQAALGVEVVIADPEGRALPPGEVGDSRVILFVRLQDGVKLDQALTDRIRQHIRASTTPRHVPAKVVQVTDIPRTKSNKIVELAVRNIVHGLPVKNIEALAKMQESMLSAILPKREKSKDDDEKRP